MSKTVGGTAGAGAGAAVGAAAAAGAPSPYRQVYAEGSDGGMSAPRLPLVLLLLLASAAAAVCAALQPRGTAGGRRETHGTTIPREARHNGTAPKPIQITYR